MQIVVAIIAASVALAAAVLSSAIAAYTTYKTSRTNSDIAKLTTDTNASVAALAAKTNSDVATLTTDTTAKIAELNRIHAAELKLLEARQKEMEQLRLEVLESDRELRNLRFTGYAPLWEAFGVLPKHRRPGFDRTTLGDLSETMTTWYYKHGLVLTGATQVTFITARDALRTVSQLPEPLIDDDYKQLFVIVSSLRTCMTSDVYSRGEAAITTGQASEREKAALNLQDALEKLAPT